MRRENPGRSLTLPAVSLCLMAAWLASAGEAAKPAKKPPLGSMTIYGNVEVEKNQAGKIAAVTVTTVNKITYRVVLDETGRGLGEAMAGKWAKIVGTPQGDGQTRSLTVYRYGLPGEDPKEEIKKRRPATRKRATTKRTTRSTKRKPKKRTPKKNPKGF